MTVWRRVCIRTWFVSVVQYWLSAAIFYILVEVGNIRNLVWFGLVWFGLIWFDLVWFGLIWFDLVWFGLIWFDLVWFGLKAKVHSCYSDFLSNYTVKVLVIISVSLSLYCSHTYSHKHKLTQSLTQSVSQTGDRDWNCVGALSLVSALDLPLVCGARLLHVCTWERRRASLLPVVSPLRSLSPS